MHKSWTTLLLKFKKLFSTSRLLSLLAVFAIFAPSFMFNRQPLPLSYFKDIYKDTDFATIASDSMAYYQKLLDGLENRKKRNEAGDVTIFTSFFLTTGFLTYDKTIGLRKSIYNNDSIGGQFIALSPYLLDEGCYFITTYDKSVLKYPVEYRLDNNRSDNPFPGPGYYAKQDVNFRIRDKSILVPVSENSFGLISPINNCVSIIFLIAALVIFISMPLDILRSISKGKPFDKTNVRDIHIIGWFFIGIPMFSGLKELILFLIFHKYFVPQLHFDWRTFYNDYFYFLLVGIAILLIGKAFKKGYKLQLEQDLTI